MDDLFKILIWGIIIFSFLRPLFKKKQQDKNIPTTKSRTDSPGYGDLSVKESEPAVLSQKNDDYDILRELQNMFKGNLKIPEQPKPKQVDPYNIYQSREIKDKNLDLVVDKRMQRNVGDQNPIGSRTTYDDNKISDKEVVVVKRTRVIDSKIEAEAQKFEKVLSGLHKKSIVQSEFIRKIKNPATIREYILFSEILGKPKALRR